MLEVMPQVCVTLAGYARRKGRETLVAAGLFTRGQIWTHDNSVGNVVQAVYERVLGCVRAGVWEPTLQPKDSAFQAPSLKRFARMVARYMPDGSLPVSGETFVSHYRGQKFLRYFAALASLRSKPIRKQDSFPSVFLKAEKWVAEKAGRLISARHPRYNLEVGRYLQPIERMVYRAIDAVFGGPTIMKGLTPQQRAEVIRQHWACFKDPVAVGQDFSKFDQHISRQALQYEHGFYMRVYPGDSHLAMLLGWQLGTTCYANLRDGRVKYTVEGGRMSGDMNTAMGNCIISAALLWAYCQERGIRVKAIVDGDDSVTFLERRDVRAYLDGIEGWMAEKGFRLVTEEPVDRISRVEFCQSRYLDIPACTMVRDPVKAITQDHAWVVDTTISYEEVMAATGLGGLSLYGNIPVLGAYYQMLARSTELSTKTLQRLSFQDSWLRDAAIGTGGYVEPSEAARYAFWLSWDITPGEQRALEREFQRRDIPGVGCEDAKNKLTFRNSNYHIVREAYTPCTNEC